MIAIKEIKLRIEEAEPQIAEIFDIKESLPSPPLVLTKIMELTSDPSTPVSKVADVLAMEPGICAQLLRLSNSAYYARSRTVSSAKEAVVMLGFHMIRSMVVSMVAKDLYEQSSSLPELRDKLWEHSLATAVFARMLATRERSCNPEEAYLTGLLHDFGKLIFMEQLGEVYAEILTSETEGLTEAHAREKSEIGIAHPILGGVIANSWLFPDQIIHAIVTHHEECSLVSLSGVAGLANLFVTSLGHNLLELDDQERELLAQFELEELEDPFEEQFEAHLALFKG